MKRIFIIILFFSGQLIAQNKQLGECGTRTPAKAAIISKEQMATFKQTQAINEPYAIKVFITVFANTNGSFRGATDINIKR